MARIGVAKAIRVGLFLALISRTILLVVTATTFGHTLLLITLMVMLPMANSLVMPVLVIAIRRYTDSKNRGFAYSVFYATMNVGSLLTGFTVDLFRKVLDGDVNSSNSNGNALQHEMVTFSWTPYRGVLAVGVVATFSAMFIGVFMREIKVDDKETDGEKLECIVSIENKFLSPSGEYTEEKNYATVHASSISYLRKTRVFVPSQTPPITSLRETFTSAAFWKYLTVGFIVTNMRMIFRHLDATLPKWMLREFGSSAPFGLVYSLNPAVVIVLTPIMGALTSEIHPLHMIRFGIFVSTVSLTFLVVWPHAMWACITFILIFSVGEAIWSPRFYDFGMKSAREGREGVFTAVAYAPVFLAQLPVGFISGALLNGKMFSLSYSTASL